jgi:DNA-binding NarL/FixJ family response regulator
MMRAAPDFEPTRREMQVLNLICNGLTSKQIAKDMGLAFKTVVCHRSSLMSKAGVANVIQLFRWAIKHRYVSTE